jgi:hypothetical protein
VLVRLTRVLLTIHTAMPVVLTSLAATTSGLLAPGFMIS